MKVKIFCFILLITNICTQVVTNIFLKENKEYLDITLKNIDIYNSKVTNKDLVISLIDCSESVASKTSAQISAIDLTCYVDQRNIGFTSFDISTMVYTDPQIVSQYYAKTQDGRSIVFDDPKDYPIINREVLLKDLKSIMCDVKKLCGEFEIKQIGNYRQCSYRYSQEYYTIKKQFHAVNCPVLYKETNEVHKITIAWEQPINQSLSFLPGENEFSVNENEVINKRSYFMGSKAYYRYNFDGSVYKINVDISKFSHEQEKRTETEFKREVPNPDARNDPEGAQEAIDDSGSGGYSAIQKPSVLLMIIFLILLFWY